MNVSYTRPIFTAIAPMEARGGRWRVEGEALAVEVVPDRYLFILINNEKPISWLFKAFRQPAFHKSPNKHTRFGWMRAIKRSEGYFEVPASTYPKFVSFEDMNDPASVILVDPNEMEKVFGVGVRLKSFALNATRKNVEIGQLRNLLPWLTSSKEKRLCPPSYTTTGTVCGSLSFSDFLRSSN
jgi:hypothetical protein